MGLGNDAMSINSFFKNTLGAKVCNPRWSWGAVDTPNKLVFLRLWDDQFEADASGQRVEIHWQHLALNSNGYTERTRHVDLLKAGYQGIGVVCTAVDPASEVRHIDHFRSDILYLLGEISEDNEHTYARVNGTILPSELPSLRLGAEQIVADLAQIDADKTIDETTKLAMVSARVGQGEFRAAVLKLWGQQCAVTGSKMLEVIRASHIKPWCKSTNSERLDPRNGIPLIASLDALFDAGLISFDESGQMLVSSRLNVQEQGIYSVHERKLSKPPTAETILYLKYHEAKIFNK